MADLEKITSASHAPEYSAQERSATLRDISVPDILEYVDAHWNDETVRATIAGPNERIQLPPDWHGAIKHGRENTGDAMVLFGSNLVEPIEGTRLSSEAFIDGLHGLNFIFESGDGTLLTDTKASQIIASEVSCNGTPSLNETPIMRAIKNDAQGKVIVEIQNGSMSPVMQLLTRLGNDPDMDLHKKEQYREAVHACLGEFLAKGATAVRVRLGLFEYWRKTFFDDCLASGATIFGDQELDDVLGRSHDHTLEEIRVAVGSTQAVTLAIKRSLERKVPLLIRVGALSYGLGTQSIGSNYLINTQKDMISLGLFTVGDMGDKLSTGREGLIYPHVRLYNPDRNRRHHETRIYLGGGLAMLELWERKITERKKQPDPLVYVLRASRINPPPESDGRIHDWGVLFDGKTLPKMAIPE